MQEPRDYSSHEEFFSYYAEKSARPEFVERFRSLQNAILRFLHGRQWDGQCLDVIDVGCNAGTQCILWAEGGHRVHGVDINQPLLDVARQRAVAAGYAIDFRLGSATQLPWPDSSMDICLAIELLEHVKQWQDCLKDFARVLRPGGLLFMTTTNNLCPAQEEFNLPVYSWYPSRLKRRFERLAVTTRPDLANYAKYPAVNWFNPYSLRRDLSRLGFLSFDRFDLVDVSSKSSFMRLIVSVLRGAPPLRLFGHICTQGSILLAVKEPG